MSSNKVRHTPTRNNFDFIMDHRLWFIVQGKGSTGRNEMGRSNVWSSSEMGGSIHVTKIPVVSHLIHQNFWDGFTGKLIQSSIGEFWGVKQAVFLENSSRPNVTYHMWFQSKNRMDEIFIKTVCWTPQNWKNWMGTHDF